MVPTVRSTIDTMYHYYLRVIHHQGILLLLLVVIYYDTECVDMGDMVCMHP